MTKDTTTPHMCITSSLMNHTLYFMGRLRFLLNMFFFYLVICDAIAH